MTERVLRATENALYFLSGEIDGQRRETYEIERSVSNMQSDMIKLNTLLHKEKGTQVMLQQENILKENDFINNLKVTSYLLFLSHDKLIYKKILLNLYLKKALDFKTK